MKLKSRNATYLLVIFLQTSVSGRGVMYFCLKFCSRSDGLAYAFPFSVLLKNSFFGPRTAKFQPICRAYNVLRTYCTEYSLGQLRPRSARELH